MASLGKDLAHIRKEKNISLNEVYEATKIPKRIIRSIEDDSIFSDFEENPTYIRSYVRSYAKALAIDEKQIVYALNKQKKNDYSGSLQKLMENKPENSLLDQNDDKTEEQKPEEAEISKKTDSVSPSEQGGPEAYKDDPIPVNTTSDEPRVRSVDWADMGRQFQPLKTAKSKTWVGILAILFILAVSGSIFYFFFYESNPVDLSNNPNRNPQQETQETISTDSLELNIVSSTDGDTSARIENTENANFQNESLDTLPDTLSVLLYAAYGKLEPVRVFTDILDDVNPYWIEHGDAMRFSFVNDIHIRGQFSRMILLLNGHVITNFREQFYNPDTRLLEIERSYFEGESKWLQPAPDSLQIDAPPPTIRERPTFN